MGNNQREVERTSPKRKVKQITLQLGLVGSGFKPSLPTVSLCRNSWGNTSLCLSFLFSSGTQQSPITPVLWVN